MATVKRLKADPPKISEIDDCDWMDSTFDASNALGYWKSDLWFIS
jgi:hypothetical protein